MSQGPTGSDIRNDSNPKSSDDLVYLLIHLLKMDCYTNRIRDGSARIPHHKSLRSSEDLLWTISSSDELLSSLQDYLIILL